MKEPLPNMANVGNVNPRTKILVTTKTQPSHFLRLRWCPRLTRIPLGAFQSLQKASKGHETKGFPRSKVVSIETIDPLLEVPKRKKQKQTPSHPSGQIMNKGMSAMMQSSGW